MTTKENKKNLLAVHPLALRGLHNIFGFDFQAPHEILYLTGNYTVKKIEKMAEAAGYDTSAALVLLTRSNDGRRSWNRDFSVVEIKGGRVDVDFSARVRASFHYQAIPFDYFYSKGSFEDVRKDEKAETYIILQAAEYLKKPEEKTVDYSQRFQLRQTR